MLRVVGCITQQHDLRLVALAACICVLASITTVNLLSLARANKGRKFWAVLVTTSMVFGSGVWALHFVAMLAYMPDMAIAYDIPLTVISALVSVGGTFIALTAWFYCPPQIGGLVLAGTLLGVSISSMHFCGVLAMRPPGAIRIGYNQALIAVTTAAFLSSVAFVRGGNLTTLAARVEAAVWLALAVIGLHFIAMSALTIDLATPSPEAGTAFGSAALAVVIGSVSFAILMVSLFATIMEQSLSRRGVLELQRMKALSDVSREALIIYRDCIILHVNAAATRMFAISQDEFIGRDLLGLITEPHRLELLRALVRGDAQAEHQEITVVAANGNHVPVDYSLRSINFDGKPATAITMHDLSGRRRDEAEIRHLAYYDVLTGLANRALLQERLVQAVEEAEHFGCPVALLYIDLDDFKKVNDLHGHTVGDCLLAEIAARWRPVIRQIDTLARIGDDQFIVVASVEVPENAALLAQRLMDAIGEPFEIRGSRLEISASIGIAIYPADVGSPEELIRVADVALHHAKQFSRGRFCFFEPAFDDQLRTRRTLEADLRHALGQGDELHLLYQPLVCCRSGEIEAFEALIRWNHPTRGRISPADFIPIAEESGLIVKLGQWVIEAACLDAIDWHEKLAVAVNVSPVQFRHDDIVQTVADCLARTGLPPERLKIEVTESILINDSTGALKAVSRLREMGIRVALDDFGTGYSSLSYLQAFSFDKLKIDQSFIARLGGADHKAETIVRTIIDLGHNLGLEVIAEGVETVTQLAILKHLGCDQVQGYLISKPIRPDGQMDVLAARARQFVLGDDASQSHEAPWLQVVS